MNSSELVTSPVPPPVSDEHERRGARRPELAPWLAVAALTILGAVLRVIVAHQSVFADELSTYWISATHGLGGVLSLLYSTGRIHHAEITPPLSFLATWVSTRFGHSAELLRAPALLAGTATIPLIYLLGLRTIGRRAALVATALATFAPFMIYYSAEARAYGLMMFLIVGSTLSLLSAVDTRRRLWWGLYAVSSAAAFYTHYTCAFVLGAQFLWLLWAHPHARRPALLANVAAAALVIPWIPGLVNDFTSPTVKILAALSPFDAFDVRIDLEHWAVGYPYVRGWAGKDSGDARAAAARRFRPTGWRRTDSAPPAQIPAVDRPARIAGRAVGARRTPRRRRGQRHRQPHPDRPQPGCVLALPRVLGRRRAERCACADALHGRGTGDRRLRARRREDAESFPRPTTAPRRASSRGCARSDASSSTRPRAHRADDGSRRFAHSAAADHSSSLSGRARPSVRLLRSDRPLSRAVLGRGGGSATAYRLPSSTSRPRTSKGCLAAAQPGDAGLPRRLPVERREWHGHRRDARLRLRAKPSRRAATSRARQAGRTPGPGPWLRADAGDRAPLAFAAFLALMALTLPRPPGQGGLGCVHRPRQPAEPERQDGALCRGVRGDPASRARSLGGRVADRIARGPNADALPRRRPGRRPTLAALDRDPELARVAMGRRSEGDLLGVVIWAVAAAAALLAAARAAMARSAAAAVGAPAPSFMSEPGSCLRGTDLRHLGPLTGRGAARARCAARGVALVHGPRAWRGFAAARNLAGRSTSRRSSLLVLAIPDLVVFRTSTAVPNVFFDPGVVQFQHDWILGSANQLLGGGALLVNVPVSQYGVGLIYFLAGWFHLAPIGYGTFGFLDGLLTALFYIAAYGVLRLAGVRRLLAGSAIVLAVLTFVYNFQFFVGQLPEEGPLRFGLPMIVVGAIGGRAPAADSASRPPGGCRAARRLGRVGARGVRLHDRDLPGASSGPRRGCVPRRPPPLAARTAGARGGRDASAAARLLALATLAGTGQLPDWRQYLAYIRSFLLGGRAGIISFGFADWSPGLAVDAAALASAAAVVLLIGRRPALAQINPALLVALTGSTAYAIALLSYTDNRSSTYLLLYVALPLLIAGTLWLSLLLAPAPSRRCRGPARRARIHPGRGGAAVLGRVARDRSALLALGARSRLPGRRPARGAPPPLASAADRSARPRRRAAAGPLHAGQARPDPAADRSRSGGRDPDAQRPLQRAADRRPKGRQPRPVGVGPDHEDCGEEVAGRPADADRSHRRCRSSRRSATRPSIR